MKRITVKEFKAEFAALAEDAKALKRRLASALRDARALAKRARGLYDVTNRTTKEGGLYSPRPGEFPKPAFKGLDKKMDKLIRWYVAEDDLADATRGL